MEYIRQATAEDSAEILKIYSRYITETAYTFEIEPPSLSDFTKRVAAIVDYHPYLLYVCDEKIVGFAYACTHRERLAYRFDVDVSIYLDMDYKGFGIGTKLYNMMFNILKAQGFYNVFSAITVPNLPSEALHKKFGFSEIGIFNNTGYKFGSWHGVRWLQKVLREYDATPAQTISVRNLPKDMLYSSIS